MTWDSQKYLKKENQSVSYCTLLVLGKPRLYTKIKVKWVEHLTAHATS